MSASTRTVPAQIGWGGFPSALAALALVVILAVAVALMAINVKATPAVQSSAKGAPAPAFIDHGSRGEFVIPAKPNVVFYDHNVDITGTYGTSGSAQTTGILSGGGWTPAAAAGLSAGKGAGSNGPRLRPQ